MVIPRLVTAAILRYWICCTQPTVKKKYLGKLNICPFKKINELFVVIESIAFSTNISALSGH